MKTFILLCIAALSAVQCVPCDEVYVKVEQGELVGKKETAYVCNTPYMAFRGIPYAEPPVGKLRFKAPVPLKSWKGTLKAFEYGNVCPEYNAVTKVYTEGDEDCLYLNVYTPTCTPTKPLSVIVFIGGYAYNFDAGELDLYGPDFLISKDLVVVTFNSRLDSLGYLNLGSKDVPGNAGLRDQLAVLKWVKKNISKFGGNPNSVTLLGHSSGASSVVHHMISPLSKNLFHRAIVLSGVPTCDAITSHKVQKRSFMLGKLLGLDTKNPDELLDYLQTLPYEELINKTVTLTASEEVSHRVIFKKMGAFVPSIETDCGQKRFITDVPLKSIELGEVNKVDALFSYSNQETVLCIDHYVESLIALYDRYRELFTPYKVLVNANQDTIEELSDRVVNRYFGNKSVCVENVAEFINYANYANMVYDVRRFAEKWPGNTYLMKFSSYGRRNFYGQKGEPYGIKGATHGDILNYLFNPKSLPITLEENTVEYNIAVALTEAVGYFAKHGNPSPKGVLGVKWPLFNKKSLGYVEFGNSPVLTVGKAPDQEEIKFWKEILECGGIKF